MIPQSSIESIRERQSITELVGETVELKRSGNRFAGLCPFHNEKTPSFYVNEEEGFYHCFGCGAHGDIFTFVRETRSLSFIEAVKLLADKNGIKLPLSSGGESPEERKQRKLRLLLRELMQHVAAVYHDHLLSNESALSYFKSRGIEKVLVERFQLGFAPDQWSFILDKTLERLSKLDNTKLPSDPSKLAYLMELSGVLKSRNNESGQGNRSSNNHYDSFRGRVMFPISRSDGVVTALGGRVIDAKSQPKYINSPETLIYKKRKTLYGLAQAMRSVRQSRSVFLVEGYMDVLALARCGVENAVASCGTALTAEHVQVLKRISDKVVVVYDGDFAGQKAAAESLELFAGSGLEVSVAVLPDSKDPDDYSSDAVNSKALAERLESISIPLAEFFLKLRMFGESANFNSESSTSSSISAARQGKVAEDFSRIVAKVGNLVEKEILIKKGSEILGVSFESMSGLVEGVRPPVAKRQPKDQTPGPLEHEADFHRVLEQEESQEPGAWERQVLVAVVSKPSLASGFLEMFAEEEMDSIPVKGGLSSKVKSFIEDVAREAPGQLPGSEKSIREILERNDLASLGIVDEALKQLTVGGGRPEIILSQADQVQSRLSIQSEIECITMAEASCSAEERQVLIQKKLALKKKLSQLSTG